MADCRSCGNPTSVTATVCSECGQTAPTKWTAGKIALAIFLAVILGTILVSMFVDGVGEMP